MIVQINTKQRGSSGGLKQKYYFHQHFVVKSDKEPEAKNYW